MTATDETRDATRRVVEAAAPSVVRIGRHGGRGCGVVVGDGLVLTNAHNLRGDTVGVRLHGGEQHEASVVAADPDDAERFDRVRTALLAARLTRPQPGRPIANISNVMVEYRPGPAPRTTKPPVRR